MSDALTDRRSQPDEPPVFKTDGLHYLQKAASGLVPDVLKPSAPGNPKDAAGAAKPQMGLIPAGAMATVARVMELGAKKYGPYNWRSAPVKKMVYAHAALRHLFAWIGGQTNDPESGYSHLAHVASCMMIILDAEAHDKAIEDRTWLSQQKDSN